MQLHCVTRVRPVEWGAIFWRAFRCNVAVGLVGGECDLHIVCRGPRIVCLVVVAYLLRLVRVESTLLKLRVRTSRQLIWLACMETLLDDVPRKIV